MALNQVGLERLNTATTKKIGTNKNIIINGAMQVAQRGTSSTTSGYGSVDRFHIQYNAGTRTHSQTEITSGSPYENGFRNVLRITNTTVGGGAGSSGITNAFQYLEAQDVASSGWNYKSSSSFVTLSFWVRSSVAQEFYGYLRTFDGTGQLYCFSLGSLSANTWTKITKTIPGNSNLTFDNNTDIGLQVNISPFWGGDFTTSGKTTDAWAAFSGANRTPDYATTWASTASATFDITGVQLEVGSVATDFEHLSFADDLKKCQRYYFRITPSTHGFYGVGNVDGGNQGQIIVNFPTEMRVKPTSLETTGTASDYQFRVTSSVNCTGVPTIDSTTTINAMVIPAASSHGLTDKSGAFFRAANNTSFLGFAGAEL